MALSFVPGPIMEARDAGPASGGGSPHGSWLPPNLTAPISRPASDDDLAFMTVGSIIAFYADDTAVLGCTGWRVKGQW